MHMGALMAVVEDATTADTTKKYKMGWGEGMNNTNGRRLEAESYIIHKHGDQPPSPSISRCTTSADSRRASR